MAHEIERKYLFLTDEWESLPKAAIYKIAQGYIDKKETDIEVQFVEKGKTKLTFWRIDRQDKAPISLTVTYNEESSFAGLEAFFEKNGISNGRLFDMKSADCRFRVRNNEMTGEEEAFITIKAATANASISDEFEELVDMSIANEILEAYGRFTVYKTRNVILVGDAAWEVDVFERQLEGLVMAEIEVEHEDDFEAVKPLPGLGQDVTNDRRYTNKSLGKFGLPK
jgi:CYTH domain-containing protein